jgi:hypothetical protein
MTTPQPDPQAPLGASLEQTRDQILHPAPIFPGRDELLVDGLSDTEEATFLAAIADA